MRYMDEPLVSVVTPVYNGGKFLRECIESILAQTYRNWDYVIVNNCSTDETLEIAAEYARRDSRIRIHNNEEFLNIYQNLNNAMRHISPDAVYCKVVHADDFLYPACLEEMVEIAHGHPLVGIVGAYGSDGQQVLWNGLLSEEECILSGRDICRAGLIAGRFIFGSPTSTMIRADLVRRLDPFYNEENPNPDLEVCHELLQTSDFAFVHRVLTFTRLHPHSQTSKDEVRGSYVYGHLLTLQKYGPVYLNEQEFKVAMNYWKLSYIKMFFKSLVRGNIKPFLQYTWPRVTGGRC